MMMLCYVVQVGRDWLCYIHHRLIDVSCASKESAIGGCVVFVDVFILDFGQSQVD